MVALRRLAAMLAATVSAAAALALPAATAAEGRTPKPAIERAAKGETCVAETAAMRRNHMKFLKHQRDDTVRGGIRGERFSLKDCVACHAGKASGTVARAPGDFCVGCHEYAAVRIDCFECHSDRPAVAATKAAP